MKRIMDQPIINELRFIATADDAGKRLDIYLTEALDKSFTGQSQLSRNAVQRLISEGGALVNGKIQDKNHRVYKNDILSVRIPEPKDLRVVSQNIPLDIVYEDACLLVINKQKGMVVHPAAGHNDTTLVNALMYHCGDSLSGINGVKRPGIVHRIDKDTSGLIIVAKNNEAHISLAKQFFDHSIEREYHAVCHGPLTKESGVINSNIIRDSRNRMKYTVCEKGGKNAVTEYSLIRNYLNYSYVSLKLSTGRTHQIRVHMAFIGHAVAGDSVYGPKSTPRELEGQCLHAKTIGFTNPETGKYMRFESELPVYFKNFLKKVS